MNPQTALLLTLALVTVGSYGWGSALIVALSRIRGGSDEPLRLDVPMTVTVGLALFIAFGGFAVAVNLAYYDTLLSWQILGAAMTLAVLVRRRRGGVAGVRRLWLVFLTGAGATAVLIIALAPFTLLRWSEADDAPGYTYLAQRLLATGGLIDPFNSRRLQNYGGAELLQAMVIRVAGTSVVDSIEAFFFCSLALALLVGSLRRPYALLGIATVALATVLVSPVGDWSNTGPSFSETVFLFALARLFADHQRRATPRPQLFALAGVLGAALFALRPQGVPAAALVIGAAALFHRGLRMKLRLGLLGAGAMLASVLGWAIALKRSSDAWVFGVDMPSWTQNSWSINPAIHTLSQHLRFLVQLTDVDSWRVGAIGGLGLSALAAVLAYLAARQQRLPRALARTLEAVRADLVLALVLGNVALLLIFAYAGDGDAPNSIGHYFAPILLAFVLFALDRTWALATVRTGELDPLPKPLAAGAALSALAFSYLFLDTGLPTLRHDIASSWDAGSAVLTGWTFPPQMGQEYWDEQYSGYYSAIEAAIPTGSYVLSGVEFPGILEFGRIRFATVDEAYGNSPPPHLPPSGNPAASVHYLRSLGITGILADLSSAPFYYNITDNLIYSHQDVRNYQLQDGSLVKWDRLLDKLQHRYATTLVGGQLRYISLVQPLH